jgi:hypothetical protein
MTISLTRDELVLFANELQRWYHEQVKYVVENLPSKYKRDEVSELLTRFEKFNPRPDWRHLLK